MLHAATQHPAAQQERVDLQSFSRSSVSHGADAAVVTESVADVRDQYLQLTSAPQRLDFTKTATLRREIELIRSLRELCHAQQLLRLQRCRANLQLQRIQEPLQVSCAFECLGSRAILPVLRSPALASAHRQSTGRTPSCDRRTAPRQPRRSANAASVLRGSGAATSAHSIALSSMKMKLSRARSSSSARERRLDDFALQFRREQIRCSSRSSMSGGC